MRDPYIPVPSIQYGTSKSKTFHEGDTVETITDYVKDNMELTGSSITKKYQITVKEMVPLKAKRWIKENKDIKR